MYHCFTATYIHCVVQSTRHANLVLVFDLHAVGLQHCCKSLNGSNGSSLYDSDNWHLRDHDAVIACYGWTCGNSVNSDSTSRS